MIKDRDFVVIPGFTVSKLGLTGNERLLYSLIYGFTKDEEHEFKGPVSYMMEWLGCSRQTVFNTLNSLIEKKLLIKKERYENNVKFVSYKAVIPSMLDLDLQYKKYTTGCENSSLGVVQNLDEGGLKLRPNNIEDNINNNNIFNKNINSETNLNSSNSKNNLKKEEKEYISESNDSSIYLEKEKKKRFEKPTFEEVEAYIREQDYDIDPHTFFDYYEACGWTVGKNKPMKDWKASVRYWVSSRKNNGDTSKPVKEEHQFNVRQYFPGDEDKIPF